MRWLLTTSKVRSLELEDQLDRHHVFPKGALKKASIDPHVANHGLNGVVLNKASNLNFGSKDTKKYIHHLLRQPNPPSESELRERVESHLIPYDVLIGSERIELRYRNFILARAKLVESKLLQLTAID